VAIVKYPVRMVLGYGATCERDEGHGQRLAVHDGELLARGRINPLCNVAGTAIPLDHATEGVIDDINGVDGDGPTVRIPRIGVQAVVSDVSVGVVGRREAVDGRDANLRATGSTAVRVVTSKSVATVSYRLST
jgi:hypothetical protein